MNDSNSQKAGFRRRISPTGTAIAVLLAGAVLGHAGNAAFAMTTGVHFGISIAEDNLCTVQLIQNGTMTLNPGFTQMSSHFAGGTPGIADVISRRAYDVSVGAYSYFPTAPTTGSDDTTFSPTFAGTNISRGRTFAERPGDQPVRLRGGRSTTRITVNLAVTKLVGVFPSGNYSATTFVRCE